MSDKPPAKPSAKPPANRKQPDLVSVTTINRDGSHFVLHPADVSGRFMTARRWFALLLLAIYVLLPWIPINGHPAVFFNVAEGRYHFMGLTFITQDLWLLFFLISGLGFGLFFVTALFGRLWCGWACPYTVFLEQVFRRIERWIDGDAPERRRLDAAPWTASKLRKRVLKHGMFILCALAISHLFLAYFVSLPTLYDYMRQSPLEQIRSFVLVFGLGLILYLCFARFREQFCIILCPYGRIQSALTDEDTTIIGYDEGRGEPRGKKGTEGAGDCIDCHRCVQVCPTGIDIRNGLQLECIGCAACIDACDEIMVKVGRPKGLVRYDSLNGFAGRASRLLRPRILLYSVLLLAGASALTLSLGRLKPIHAQVNRQVGMPFYVQDGQLRNQYKLELATKRNVETVFDVEFPNLPETARVSVVREALVLEPQSRAEATFNVTMPGVDFEGPFDLEVRISAEPGGSVIYRRIAFLGPDPRFFQQDREERDGRGSRSAQEGGGE